MNDDGCMFACVCVYKMCEFCMHESTRPLGAMKQKESFIHILNAYRADEDMVCLTVFCV